MKKRIKQLIIAVVLLVLCIIGYIVIPKMIDYSDVMETSGLDSILSTDTSTINSLEVVWGKYTTKLVKENGVWKVEGRDGTPNNELVDTALKYAGNIHARKTISDHGDLKEYGMDQPQYTINFTTSDGKNVKYYIGNYNNMDEAFFLMLDGDQNIYTVATDYADAFSFNEDLILKEF